MILNFTPDKKILDELSIDLSRPYIFMRFVSWSANHDFNQSGISYSEKLNIISTLSEKFTILISAEGILPKELQKYRIKIAPEKIHHVLAFATLFIGEGATMASECAMLGTPAIYINSITAGTLEEQERYGLLFGFRNSNGVIEKVFSLLNNRNLKEEFFTRRQKLLSDKIDITAFLVWFIENYPESKMIMKENPDFQYNFK